ncbi:hypothetical protein CXK57_01295 [Neisseria gonorrhoeae]|nr:hypothetical protein AW44_01855 [Neisseria gonorrhoeae]ROU26016.1 hypothetical protein EGO84_00775 [Neisseria gonorrhoeae]ROU36157.1 hypothetical protein EGP27_00765 [Neisseria gonorrhoeae]ROU46995.1 hypothetical protein EGO70_00775 [Neisseria gonorrhoeae]ROU69649.1 hypothetical protein EGO76_00780 [Neisseria gonorrhoeae]
MHVCNGVHALFVLNIQIIIEMCVLYGRQMPSEKTLSAVLPANARLYHLLLAAALIVSIFGIVIKSRLIHILQGRNR